MNARNFAAAPCVASASSAADASGVCVVGTADESTSASSRTRSFSKRFSLLLYTASAVRAKPVVRSSPTRSTMLVGREARQRQKAPTAAVGAVAASLRSAWAEPSCSALMWSSRPARLAVADPLRGKLADRQAVYAPARRRDGHSWLAGAHRQA